MEYLSSGHSLQIYSFRYSRIELRMDYRDYQLQQNEHSSGSTTATVSAVVNRQGTLVYVSAIFVSRCCVSHAPWGVDDKDIEDLLMSNNIPTSLGMRILNKRCTVGSGSCVCGVAADSEAPCGSVV